MGSSLQKMAVKGAFWSGFGSLAFQLVQLICGILLARLLSPEDFGLVGMLSVFLLLSACIVESGMTTALVRKKDIEDVDCSTVFIFSLSVSAFLYGVLYIAAPCIADFYHAPILTELTRVCALTLVIKTLGAVHSTILYRNLEFKKIAFASVISSLISCVIAIVCACYGAGVWALVYMQVSASAVQVLILWILVRWCPKPVFSLRSFRELFGFGSNMLISSIVGTVVDNVQPLLIGKFYSGAELGFFSKATTYANLPVRSIHGMVSGVAFPILCRFQDDIASMREKWRMMNKLSCFLIFPVAMGLAAVAEPMVLVLLTEKWAPAAILIQLLSFSLMFYPVHGLNLDLLRAMGRSDLLLRAQIMIKVLGLLIVLCMVPFGVVAMCWGAILGAVLSLFIDTHYGKLMINVSLYRQIADLLPIFCMSFFMATSVYLLVTFLPLADEWLLIIGILAGTIIYVGGAALFRMRELTYTWELVSKHLRPRS